MIGATRLTSAVGLLCPEPTCGDWTSDSRAAQEFLKSDFITSASDEIASRLGSVLTGEPLRLKALPGVKLRVKLAVDSS
jgi:hypothetical protein